MKKKRLEYDDSIDALVAVSKRLSLFEERYRTTSEDFFHRYSRGQADDSVDSVEWANDYQHYLAIRAELEKGLRHVA